MLDVAYSGVNLVDMNAAQGQLAADAPMPRTLGTEGAGTVDGRPVDVPAEVGLETAAAMGVAGVTARRTVTEIAQVKADDTVLVLGASGGVGSIIVSVARAVGATVIGQTGHESNAEWIKQGGADQVIVTDSGGLTAAVANLHPTVALDGLGNGSTGAAAALSEVDGVASVLVGNDQAADD